MLPPRVISSRYDLKNSCHKEVWVECGDMKAEIDELLAPMISIMWKLGIKTKESCQGTPTELYPNLDGWSAIYFRGIEDPQKFLKLAFQPTEEQIQIVKERGLPLCLPFNEWKMTCIPTWENGKIEFGISVKFPSSAIPVLIERLRSYES